MGTGVFQLAVLLTLVTLVPWLIALVDVLRSEFTDRNKVVWVLVVLLVPVVGWIAYFAFGMAQKRRPPEP